MRLSTRGRYGIKAMIDLALAYGKGPLSTATLAQQQGGISDAYLEQLVSSLRKAGLVKSTRGAQGGYSLSRSPQDINALDILSALENSTNVIDCVGYDEQSGCENACSCSARPLWLKLQNNINDVLASSTLLDMANDYKNQKGRTANDASLS